MNTPSIHLKVFVAVKLAQSLVSLRVDALVNAMADFNAQGGISSGLLLPQPHPQDVNLAASLH